MATADEGLHIHRAFIDQDREILARCFKYLKIDVRRNTRKNCIEYKQELGIWKPLEDTEDAHFRQLVSEHCFIQKTNSNDFRPVKMGIDRWQDAILGLCFDKQIDPFLKWLDGLPEWDGEERIKSLIKDVFETDSPHKLLEFASYAPLVAAVRRARHPGWKYDHMIVLHGPQGSGKSTFWKELLPDSEFFSDDLDLAAGSKERAEQLQGKVLVESAELRGMSRAELNSLKAFISRNSDYYRAAYARFASDHKRMCVIVGTTNDQQCLPNDSSGNRRFVVVSIKPLYTRNAEMIKEYLDEHRKQIWAEAVYLHENESEIFVPPELQSTQETENEKFRSSPHESLEEAVLSVMANYPHGDLSLAEIEGDVFQKVKNQKPDYRDRQVVKETLRRAGARPERVVIDGVRRRVWKLPEKPEIK